MSAVPERMRFELGSDEGATSAVAVAPGVWTKRSPGTTIEENAAGGSLVGWCASVNVYANRVGSSAGQTCW
jgi:hypothetical protein